MICIFSIKKFRKSVHKGLQFPSSTITQHCCVHTGCCKEKDLSKEFFAMEICVYGYKILEINYEKNAHITKKNMRTLRKLFIRIRIEK